MDEKCPCCDLMVQKCRYDGFARFLIGGDRGHFIPEDARNRIKLHLKKIQDLIDAAEAVVLEAMKPYKEHDKEVMMAADKKLADALLTIKDNAQLSR